MKKLLTAKGKKRNEALKEKGFFPYQSLSCDLDNSQVKDAKANHTYSKPNHQKL